MMITTLLPLWLVIFYDTVDHDILLKKLCYYGFDGKANQILKSYLSDRKMFVKLSHLVRISFEMKRKRTNNHVLWY